MFLWIKKVNVSFLFGRKQKEEAKKLLNEERDRRRAEAKLKIQARQQQERIEHVRNAIVSWHVNVKSITDLHRPDS